MQYVAIIFTVVLVSVSHDVLSSGALVRGQLDNSAENENEHEFGKAYSSERLSAART